MILRVNASLIYTLGCFCLTLVLALRGLLGIHTYLSPDPAWRIQCRLLLSFFPTRDGLGPFSGPWRIMVYKCLLWGFSRSNQSRTKYNSHSSPSILQKGNQPMRPCLVQINQWRIFKLQCVLQHSSSLLRSLLPWFGGADHRGWVLETEWSAHSPCSPSLGQAPLWDLFPRYYSSVGIIKVLPSYGRFKSQWDNEVLSTVPDIIAQLTIIGVNIIL